MGKQDKVPEGIDLIDLTDMENGSIVWMKAMEHNIIEKFKHKELLGPLELHYIWNIRELVNKRLSDIDKRYMDISVDNGNKKDDNDRFNPYKEYR